MSKTTQVVVTIVAVILGLAVGYGIAYGMYQPYQTEASKLRSDITTVQATLSQLQANYSNAQTVLNNLNELLQEILVPNVTLLSYPSQVGIGDHFIVKWNVTGGIPGRIVHTEVHTVNISSPSEDIILSQIFTGYTPQSFESIVTAPEVVGTFRFHIHAIVDTTEVFTQEKTISVVLPPKFEVVLSAKALSINRGDNRTITVTVTSVGSFSSPVTLTLTSLPSGVTATLDKTIVTPPPGGGVNASLQITVALNAVAWTYTVRVTGADGSVTESDGLAITVTEPYPPVDIEIRSLAFYPSAVVIHRGTTVTWTNMDPETHTVMSPEFGLVNLQPGESWSYTFDQVGTFNYQCTIHPEMTGTITVIP